MTLPIKAMLEDIVAEFSRNRQIGHTKMACEAVLRTPGAKLVVVENATKRNFQKSFGVDAITVSELSPGRAYGPLVFDNSAIVQLCAAALEEMDRLKREKKELEGRIAAALL